MRSCDTCPGGAACAGINLAPVLAEVHELYKSGITDKFDILFALEPESEELIERHNDKISRDCWTRAALLTIAGIIAKTEVPDGADAGEVAHETLRQAIKAFENFPWEVSELMEQAPNLYEAVQDLSQDSGVETKLSKRGFIKVCKNLVYT